MKPLTMLFSLLLVIFFHLSFAYSANTTEKVGIVVKAQHTIASTDNSFVCVCMDWWPSDKCNYGWCPWENSSALTVNLENTFLNKAIEAFSIDPKDPSKKNQSPLRLRIGGSLQDQVIYRIGKNRPKCPKFRLVKGLKFDFTSGCLNMCRWNKLNKFFDKNGVVITFGLNAMLGRKLAPKSKQVAEKSPLYEGSWDSSNAKSFMNYTLSKGFNVDSWEFGNELSGDGVSWRVGADTYGRDLINLRNIINELYRDKLTKPKLLSPGGFYDKDWFNRMLQVSGPNVVDVATHHIYNLGPGNAPDLFSKMQDPTQLSKVVKTFTDMEETIHKHPWASAWVGESGGAFNSGGEESHQFVNGFWYLDQLGMASKHNTKAYCRQALLGGNYQLIDRKTLTPNIDYYNALLWHRLMGSGVLEPEFNTSDYLRVYAHCGREKSSVTLLLINLSNSTAFDLSVGMKNQNVKIEKPKSEGEREDYYLTPKDGNLRSTVMLLNGNPLQLSSSGEIPEMKPIGAKATSPIHIVPSSMAFINFKDFGASACNS